MAEQELQMEEGGKKGKMMIIIIAAVVLIGGAAAFFLMSGSDDPVAEDMPMEQSMEEGENAAPAAAGGSRVGTALYVAMPRPLRFQVPSSSGREREVQIKVQLMVRGTDNEEKAKMHIPLIEGTVLKVFSTANADDLVTEAGKADIKERSLKEVQKVLQEIVGSTVVEQVLFTGFVMQ